MTRSNALNFTSLRSTLYVHMLTIPGPWLCLFQKWPPPLWRAQEFEYVAKMWAKWNTKRLNQFKKLFIWPLMWCKSVLGQLASKLLTKHHFEDSPRRSEIDNMYISIRYTDTSAGFNCLGSLVNCRSKRVWGILVVVIWVDVCCLWSLVNY